MTHMFFVAITKVFITGDGSLVGFCAMPFSKE
jgi:hypothetical protein